MKILNTIISSSNNIYLVENNEIKNIELKKVENLGAFFIPTIRNTTAATSILQVNFQTDYSGAAFVFYIQLLPFIGPSRTIKFYLNDIEIVGNEVNSSGIYKITINPEQQNPTILKLD